MQTGLARFRGLLCELGLSSLDWKAAVNDVRPLLMVGGEADLITLDTVTRLLDNCYVIRPS